MTEDIRQRLSLALARARRLDPGKSLLELLESMIASDRKAPAKPRSPLLTDEELLSVVEAWIIRKKSIVRRTSDKTGKPGHDPRKTSGK